MERMDIPDRPLDMYAVTPDDLMNIIGTGDVPEYLHDMHELSDASVRAGVFLAAVGLAREYPASYGAFDVMDNVMPLITDALERGRDPFEGTTL